MTIEAVTVCVNYADFLAQSLPLNKGLFDRIVVVTTPEDRDTQRVCDLHNVLCVTTRVFGPPGEFHKARGINVGLRHLQQDGWVVHMDADTVLPAQARDILNRADLDPTMIYGVDRSIVTGWQTWQRHLHRPRTQQELAACLVHMDTYPLGARLNVPSHHGWAPIGFFQLWNPAVSGVHAYPEEHNGADRTDMLFACQWPRNKRGLIPEMIAWHLESERGPQGLNWMGRQSRPFSPVPRARVSPHHAIGVAMVAVSGITTGQVLIQLLAVIMLLGAVGHAAYRTHRDRCDHTPGKPLPNPYVHPPTIH